MSKKIVGIVLLLIGGLFIGWYAGQSAFSVFEQTVPAGAVTDLVRGGTRTWYVVRGLGLGVVIAAYALLAAWLSPFFRTGRSSVSSGRP